MTQVRSANKIKVIYSNSHNTKIPTDIIKNFDLANYEKEVLRSQESLVVEPRMTRAKKKALEEESQNESDDEDFFEDDDTVMYDGPSFSKKVTFDDKVRTQFIENDEDTVITSVYVG